MKKYILTSDIGGTNTSIGIIEYDGKGFKLLTWQGYQTYTLESFSQALSHSLAEFSKELGTSLVSSITSACLSIAGPVKNQRSVPTNINWILDGKEIEQEFSIETTIINDFTAICYGIPLLDINNPEQITPLPSQNGEGTMQSSPVPGINIKAVVGAGTGLGVGFLIEERDRTIALPAEGGHIDLAPHNQTIKELASFTEQHCGSPLDAERLVSGNGLCNIFKFMKHKGAISQAIQEIEGLDIRQRPEAISRFARTDMYCKNIITLFVEMYARIAQTFALAYIPCGGLFLAGGIASKNKEFFLEENRFMKNFLHNINDSIKPLLADIPVYIVNDYRISLYGAAHSLVQHNLWIKY